MYRSKQGLTLSVEADPFQNMIQRPNRSPVLKPVVVSSRSHLQVSRSAGSLREKFKLPPLVNSRKTQNYGNASERDNIHTPDFKITSRVDDAANFKNKGKFRPPAPQALRKSKKLPQFQQEFKEIVFDVSFGDVEENVGGLNEKMKRYKY
jgi:hypothetical protein